MRRLICRYCIGWIEPYEESADAIDLSGVLVGAVHSACAKAWRLRLIELRARQQSRSVGAA